jgi:hypothetical protein
MCYLDRTFVMLLTRSFAWLARLEMGDYSFYTYYE